MRDTIASFLAAARASFEVLLLAKVRRPPPPHSHTPTHTPTHAHTHTHTRAHTLLIA